MVDQYAGRIRDSISPAAVALCLPPVTMCPGVEVSDAKRSSDPHSECQSAKDSSEDAANSGSTGDMWIFGFGSLVHNPSTHADPKAPLRLKSSITRGAALSSCVRAIVSATLNV